MFSSFSNWCNRHPSLAFFVLTFSLAWAIWIPMGLLAPRWFFFAILPGAWAPTISAVWLTRLTKGKIGVRQFLGKLQVWRVGIGWYAVVLLGTAFIAYLALGFHLLLGGHIPPFALPNGLPREAWPMVLPLTFLINIFFGGPLAEDIGWRGYVLPQLYQRMSTLQASLIVGVIWVVWHLPFFVFPEGAVAVGHVPFVWFALLTIAWSVLFAWIYVNTESILMPVLFHAAINTTLGTLGVLGQARGGLLPVVLNTSLTWIAVGLVIAIFGRDLKREKQARQQLTDYRML